MKLIPFSILTFLALIYTTLTLAETGIYASLEKAQVDQKILQQKVVFFQRLNEGMNSLLKRMGAEAVHDAPLAAMLKAHNINVVVVDSMPMKEMVSPDPSVNPPAPTTALPVPVPTK